MNQAIKRQVSGYRSVTDSVVAFLNARTRSCRMAGTEVGLAIWKGTM